MFSLLLGSARQACIPDPSYSWNDPELSITGSGDVCDIEYDGSFPWDSYRTTAQTITIGSGITRIANYMFRQFTALSSLTIPDTVAHIGRSAFDGCTSLTNVELRCVQVLEESAFSGSGLVTITFGALTEIGDAVFASCPGLTELVIPDTVLTIGGAIVNHCVNLQKVVLPTHLDEIPSNTYWGCTGLTVLPIPDHISRIGSGAFYDCDVTEVVIPESVEVIMENAFTNIQRLTTVQLPGSLTSISDSAFDLLPMLEKVEFYGTNDPRSDLTTNTVFPASPLLTKVAVLKDYNGDSFCGLPVEKILTRKEPSKPSTTEPPEDPQTAVIAGATAGAAAAVGGATGAAVVKKSKKNLCKKREVGNELPDIGFDNNQEEEDDDEKKKKTKKDKKNSDDLSDESSSDKA